jgi:Pyridoxamine 5'-phosphate oxidase
MASWAEISAADPDFAARAQALLDARTHKTLATLRRDGSPRISGTETNFRDGEVWIGSMWQAVKALDLQRDPRYALHSGSDDPAAGWLGDAKIAGRAEEITDPDRVREVNGSEVGTSHLFRLDITELVVVHLSDDRKRLVIDSWHEGRGLSSLTRD